MMIFETNVCINYAFRIELPDFLCLIILLHKTDNLDLTYPLKIDRIIKNNVCKTSLFVTAQKIFLGKASKDKAPVKITRISVAKYEPISDPSCSRN